MTRVLFLISLLFGLAVLEGCGPSTTARDQENNQEKTYIRDQQQQMAPYAGCFTGHLNDNVTGKAISTVFLQAYVSSSFQLVPGRNKLVEIPVLMGYLESRDTGLVYAVMNMSAVTANGHLVMWSSSFSSNGIGSPMMASGLDLVVDGDKLTGNYFGPNVGRQVVLARSVNDTDCNYVGPGDPAPPDPADPGPIVKPEPTPPDHGHHHH